jgi:hypothetical protein
VVNQTSLFRDWNVFYNFYLHRSISDNVSHCTTVVPELLRWKAHQTSDVGDIGSDLYVGDGVAHPSIALTSALQYPLLSLHCTMPPRKSPLTGLTKPEQLLLQVASRLDTALRYLEDHPGEDQSIYFGGIAQEVVRRISVYSNQCSELICNRNILRQYTVNIHSLKPLSTACTLLLQSSDKSGRMRQVESVLWILVG